MIKLILVNALSFLRIVFSLLFAYYIMIFSSNIIIMAMLFLIICTTDFFDGRLARKWMASTKFGAILDVIADLFFIVTAYSALIIQNIIPVWVLAIVLLKFSEFCITSFVAKKTGKGQSTVFFFDILGRIVVLIFYVLPVQMIFLKHYLFPELFYPVVNIIGYILTIMACISSFYRVKMCLEPIQFQRNYDIVNKQSSWVQKEITPSEH